MSFLSLDRYHVYVHLKRATVEEPGGIREVRKRTTVTIPNEVAGMLAAMLDADPFHRIGPDAHSVVRVWLQKQLDGPLRNLEGTLSRLLTLCILREIARPEVREKYEYFQLEARGSLNQL
jgi:hypothetical protein